MRLLEIVQMIEVVYFCSVISMEERSVQPLCSFKEFEKHLGTYFPEVSTVLEPICDIHVKDASSSKTLFILRKNVLPLPMIHTTIEHYLPIMKKMESSNRGFAAGNKERIQREKYERSNPVHSTIAGYIDSPNNKYPCRMTQFSKKYFDAYQQGLPMIRTISNTFKETLPLQYANQLEYVKKTKYCIEETVFTTVTINYNFQTALHVDKGDCKEGFGTLVVCSNKIHGGYIMFPRFNIGIVVNTGDILFMDVHEYHCNSKLEVPLEDSYRLSFVCYLRTRLLDCRHNELLQELGIEEGKHWDTEMLVTKILEKISTKPLEKLLFAENPKNWKAETNAYMFTCKNRQYKLYDKIFKKSVLSLHNIWNYLKVTANL